MRKSWLLGIVLIPQILFSQIKIGNQSDHGKHSFPLCDGINVCQVYYDPGDHAVVKKAAEFFVQDIEQVTGKKAAFASSEKLSGINIVLIGTIGHNQLIDTLIQLNRIDVEPVLSQWERFIIQIVDHPFPNVKKALVVAGSDRRGTAYGVFSISEALGVSPWYWWADVPAQKRESAYINTPYYVSKAPSVKYRGIFINDEDWGMKPWASKLMDPSLNDIGPKTYAKVCELLLRLKANYLWPAMHECSGAFNKYPENKMVADSFAIVMGSSHCEPLLFNNASEWDKKTMGEWNYKTNKDGILKQLDQRVKSNAEFENVYTLALRGLHDAAMVGNLTLDEKVLNLENAIADQRAILKKYINAPLESIPQILIPYKEVMELYEQGVKVPDDVTLVWPDDNYGYLKRLSTPDEQKRSGRAGVYYHVSYLGSPHNNIWMSTTPPALMVEELSKAYRTGADRVWVVNVGDIKACEYSMNLFLDMAWDIEQFDYDTVNKYHAQWCAQIAGNRYENELQEIWDCFNYLAFIRKPEYMGWGYEWNSRQANTEIIVDTDFSFSQFREAEKRLHSYDTIARRSSRIMAELPDALKPAFFQLVDYPVRAAAFMNKKMLTAQQNRLYAKQDRAITNSLAELTQAYQDSLQSITDRYNALLNGKWDGMMSLKQGWYSSVHQMPPISTIALPDEPNLGIFAEGDEQNRFAPTPFSVLPTFDSYAPKTYYIDVVNKGGGVLKWHVNSADAWITLSQTSGETPYEQRITVSIDWDNRPAGEYVFGEIEFASGEDKKQVIVSTFKPDHVSHDDLKGLFVEQNGYLSIPASDFHRKTDSSDVPLLVIDGLGVENKSIQFGNPKTRILNPQASIDVSAEYDFYTFNSGTAHIYIYALPVFPLNPLEHARYSFSVDNGLIFTPDISAPEYSDEWKQNVLRNFTINASEIYLQSPGKHTLKIMGRAQGIVIQKIVIDMGGLKDSYTGPESTQVE